MLLLFTVVVPEGGVKEGEEFEVPYPTAAEVVSGSAVAVGSDPTAAPHGAWKNDLFSCCDAPQCCGLFWAGLCCTPIVQAQLLTRMSLDWCGLPVTPEQAASTFATVMIIFVVYLVFNWWVPFVGMAFLIYSLIEGTRLRGTFRKKYDIAPSCFGKGCNGGLDDCCCVFWCGCCTVRCLGFVCCCRCVGVCVRERRRYLREQYTHTPLLFLQAIQMHRHTHDETQYPYECCTINGLPPTAPIIV